MILETLLNQFDPDYSVPPGWVLEEYLETLGISHAEFAHRCGCSSKLIGEIISGKAPLEPKMALQFEKILDLDASIWLGIESSYQAHQVRTEERKSHNSVSGEPAGGD